MRSLRLAFGFAGSPIRLSLRRATGAGRAGGHGAETPRRCGGSGSGGRLCWPPAGRGRSRWCSPTPRHRAFYLGWQGAGGPRAALVRDPGAGPPPLAGAPSASPALRRGAAGRPPAPPTRPYSGRPRQGSACRCRMQRARASPRAGAAAEQRARRGVPTGWDVTEFSGRARRWSWSASTGAWRCGCAASEVLLRRPSRSGPRRAAVSDPDVVVEGRAPAERAATFASRSGMTRRPRCT